PRHPCPIPPPSITLPPPSSSFPSSHQCCLPYPSPRSHPVCALPTSSATLGGARSGRRRGPSGLLGWRRAPAQTGRRERRRRSAHGRLAHRQGRSRCGARSTSTAIPDLAIPQVPLCLLHPWQLPLSCAAAMTRYAAPSSPPPPPGRIPLVLLWEGSGVLLCGGSIHEIRRPSRAGDGCGWRHTSRHCRVLHLHLCGIMGMTWAEPEGIRRI
ncbi:unnamed protein product, partial [Urochloa humidicola]